MGMLEMVSEDCYDTVDKVQQFILARREMYRAQAEAAKKRGDKTSAAAFDTVVMELGMLHAVIKG